MRDTIKALLQSRQHPLVTAVSEDQQKQVLYLYQYKGAGLLQGQYISAGTYLLTDKESGDHLIEMGMVKQSSSDSITAFVLPYEQYKTTSITLDDSADLMVTALLTGCTFAGELGEGDSTVYHINKPIEVDGTWTTDQKGIDTELEGLMEGKKSFSIKKDDYNIGQIDTASSATVIGIREEGAWNFHSQYQHVTETSDDYEVRVRPGKESKSSYSALVGMSITSTLHAENLTEDPDVEEKKGDSYCFLQ